MLEIKVTDHRQITFVTLMSSFEGTSYKIYKMQPLSSFLSYCFTLAFKSADIFHNFLEPCSTLSEIRFMTRIFTFLTGSLKPHPLKSQLPLSLMKFFWSVLP